MPKTWSELTVKRRLSNYDKKYYPNAKLGPEKEHYIIINPIVFYDNLVLFESNDRT